MVEATGFRVYGSGSKRYRVDGLQIQADMEPPRSL